MSIACSDPVSEADPIGDTSSSTAATTSADPSPDASSSATTGPDASGGGDSTHADPTDGSASTGQEATAGSSESDTGPGGSTGSEPGSTSGDGSSTDGAGNSSGEVSASGDDGGTSGEVSSSGDDGSTSGEVSTGEVSTGDVSSGEATSGEASTSGDGAATGGGNEDGGMLPDGVLYREDFDGNDGDPWPAPWTIVGDNVISAAIQGGRGQLAGVTDGTARLVLPGFDELDIEMRASIEFSDWSAQGFGLYARQNGGALDQTEPPGEGYSLFIEGFYLESLGFWREVLGVETLIDAQYDPVAGGVIPGVVYRMRFQVEQVHPTYSAMRGKIWPAAEPEPDAWTISILDDTASVQNVAGSFAVDVYNDAGTDSIWIDDIEILAL